MNKKKATIYVDEDMFERASLICNVLGISISAAIDIFLHKLVRANGIPFPVTFSKDSSKNNEE